LHVVESNLFEHSDNQGNPRKTTRVKGGNMG
jgi:hypothetical protein